MKRIIFIILLAVIGVSKISAQEVDLQQENSTDARIEELSKEVAELSQKLEKLEEDYEYLALVNQLYDVLYEMEMQINYVQIKTNEIVVWCYNSSFDIDLYLLKEKLYDQFQDYYNLCSQTSDGFSQKISNLKFSDEKQYSVVQIYGRLTSALSSLEHSIQFFKRYLDVYKKKGKGF